jgi:hypothetical protein
MVKIVYCISKLPRLSNEEFHRYWRDTHGPIAGKIPGCRKYVQSHTIHRALGEREPAFDGVAELWSMIGRRWRPRWRARNSQPRSKTNASSSIIRARRFSSPKSIT